MRLLMRTFMNLCVANLTGVNLFIRTFLDVTSPCTFIINFFLELLLYKRANSTNDKRRFQTRNGHHETTLLFIPHAAARSTR